MCANRCTSARFAALLSNFHIYTKLKIWLIPFCSRRIANTNCETIEAFGFERLSAIMDDIRADRERSDERSVNASNADS